MSMLPKAPQLKPQDVLVLLNLALREDEDPRIAAEEGAPVCRWLFDDLVVDVMSALERVLGFSNRWYRITIERFATPTSSPPSLAICRETRRDQSTETARASRIERPRVRRGDARYSHAALARPGRRPLGAGGARPDAVPVHRDHGTPPNPIRTWSHSPRVSICTALGPAMHERCPSPFGSSSDSCRGCARQVRADGLTTCKHLAAQSPAMQEVLRRALAIAHTSAPVVLLGETGTGKEVLARALHHGSTRSGKPFVPVNCGAIPGELLESELFGHVRGAFSGAVADKPGLFEAASGGTLLLDEVADLPALLQVKLLRVLQDGEVRRVGANRSVAMDVRVIAATHKDLEALVELGTFRADLFFRLKVFSLRLPALRDRREDILPLARHFLAAEAEPAHELGPAAEDALLRYRWPGNIRELSNAMRYASALSDVRVIEPHHLPDEVVCGAASAPAPAVGALRTLVEVEQEHVMTVLRACGGVKADAARVLGIGRNTLWRMLRRLAPAPRAPSTAAASPPAREGRWSTLEERVDEGHPARPSG
jgi:two-component system response regulator HydG